MLNSVEYQDHIRFFPSRCSQFRISSAHSKSLILCRTRRTTAVVQGTWLLDTHMVRFHSRPVTGPRIVTAWHREACLTCACDIQLGASTATQQFGSLARGITIVSPSFQASLSAQGECEYGVETSWDRIRGISNGYGQQRKWMCQWAC